MKLYEFESGNDFGYFCTLKFLQFRNRTLLGVEFDLTDDPYPGLWLMFSMSPSVGLVVDIGICGSGLTLNLLEKNTPILSEDQS